MKSRRHRYFIVSFTLSILGLAFCWLCYRSGQFEQFEIGSFFLQGIPNYYFFYIFVLPFIGTSVAYLAFENKTIRLFGEIDDNLDAENRSRIERYRLKLLFAALLISVLVGIQDAGEKTTALPSYSFELGAENNAAVADYYACLQGLSTCSKQISPEARETCYAAINALRGSAGQAGGERELSPEEQNACYLGLLRAHDFDPYRETGQALSVPDGQACYLAILQQQGFDQQRVDGSTLPSADAKTCYLAILRQQGFEGQRVSGFESVSHWWQQSSALYKFESLLSFLAALLISLLFVQLFLLLMVKDQVRSSTKSIVIWMAVLGSFWFPTKLYSSWRFDLGPYEIPGTLWFGIIVLVIAILLIVFLKTERDNLYKYAEIVVAVFSVLITAVGIAEPELIQQAVSILGSIGPIYIGIVSFIFIFSLYLVTDHFLSNYEQDSAGQ